MLDVTNEPGTSWSRSSDGALHITRAPLEGDLDPVAVAKLALLIHDEPELASERARYLLMLCADAGVWE